MKYSHNIEICPGLNANKIQIPYKYHNKTALNVTNIICQSL